MASSPNDRTTSAIARQLRAMACPVFEVGIYDRPADRMRLRRWTSEEILAAVAWLKRSNVQDSDIYIRPEGSQGLVLVDDLPVAALEKLKADGLSPAAFIRTSEANFQAWIRVSSEPIPTSLATAAAKILAKRYGGDPHSADWRHFGRLAGFTNRKRIHVDETGRYPFVIVWEATGAAAKAAPDLFLEASNAEPLSPPPPVSKGAKGGSKALGEPIAYFKGIMACLEDRFGGEIDYSRADWMAVQRMAQAGFEYGEILVALRMGSPQLGERKQRHIEDYCTRTVEKALALQSGVNEGKEGRKDASTEREPING